jgi:hypothetical protein
MLSYTVDGKVTVDRSSHEQKAIVRATVAEGVLRLTRKIRQTATYRIKMASIGERRLIIEQPRLAGWTLAAPDPARVELSADAYRIPATVTPNKETVVGVTLERPLEETIRLMDVTDDTLAVLVASNELEASVRKALAELAVRRQTLGRQAAELERLKEQRRQLVEDEKRLRDNLAAAGRDSALYKQTLDKLGAAEASIETVSSAIANKTAEIAASREQLQAFVSALAL